MLFLFLLDSFNIRLRRWVWYDDAYASGRRLASSHAVVLDRGGMYYVF